MALSNIKVLLLNVNREGWHSGNMIYDMWAVQRACDTKTYGPGWPDYKHTEVPKIIEQLYGRDKPDVIYSYFLENERVRDCYMQHYQIPQHLGIFHQGLQAVKGPLKIYALSDFWAKRPATYAARLVGSSFSHCFCCFAPPYADPKQFFAFFNENVRKEVEFVGYPRCVDARCFRDYGLPKKYDVVSLGAMWHFYPLRVKMHRYLQANHQALGVSYKNYPHCGTDFSHSTFVRDTYARAISEGKMLASCGGKYHVAMNKIFEAMGCGTAYVGERVHGFDELHLKDGHNYITVTGDNFVEKIQYYLQNEDECQRIATNARETFLQHHTIDARARELVAKLEGLL